VFAGILIFVGLTSDIGFSAVVTEYRYYILICSIFVAAMCALFIVNRILFREVQELEQQLTETKNTLETTNNEKEGVANEVRQRDYEIDHLRETVSDLYRQITGGSICEVERVEYFRERLHLSIKKDSGDGWVRGDVVRVIDTNLGDIMGIFEVTDIQETGYRAKSTHFVNPLWLGYILDSRSQTLPPDTVAILFPKDRMRNE
jgi:hypothetical protein